MEIISAEENVIDFNFVHIQSLIDESRIGVSQRTVQTYLTYLLTALLFK